MEISRLILATCGFQHRVLRHHSNMINECCKEVEVTRRHMEQALYHHGSVPSLLGIL